MNRLSIGVLAALLLASPGLASAQSDPEAAYEGKNVYYGDLHNHTYYSPDAAQMGWSASTDTPWEALKFARDVARLDFCCVTDHGEQFIYKGGTPGHTLLGSMAATGPKGSPSWQDEVAAADAYDFEENENVAGRDAFVTFCGWEWTGGQSLTSQSPAGAYTGNTGHRCVIWNSVKHEDGSYVLPSSVTSVFEASTPPALWQTLDAFCAQHPRADYITNPHTTAEGGCTIDWGVVNAQRQVLVEIFSKHGSSESFDAYLHLRHGGKKGFDRTGSIENALLDWRSTGDPAYQLGFIANTDGHCAQPGNVFEGWYLHDPNATGAARNEAPNLASGGHAVVFAPKKTRAAIWKGLRDKLTYATSGARIRLYVTATTDQSATTLMGQATTATSGSCVTLNMKAYGQSAPVATAINPLDPTGANLDLSTAPIQSFEIVRDGTKVATLPAGDGIAQSWTDPTPVTGPTSYYVRALQAPTTTCQSPANAAPLPPDQAPQLSERAWSSPVYVTVR